MPKGVFGPGSGGARVGAGRKKGVKNKITVDRLTQTAEFVEKAKRSGQMPLDIVLSVMRGGPDAEQVTERQYHAAVDALPYVHARLASTTVTHRDALDELSVDDLRSLLATAERLSWLTGGEDTGEISSERTGKPH